MVLERTSVNSKGYSAIDSPVARFTVPGGSETDFVLAAVADAFKFGKDCHEVRRDQTQRGLRYQMNCKPWEIGLTLFISVSLVMFLG